MTVGRAVRRAKVWLWKRAWPEDRRGWGTIALLLVFAAHLVRYLTNKPRLGPDGDGFYSWIFARSIAFDLDVHLANDYAVCGDIWSLGVDEGGHRPANPFYLGPSVYLSPLIFVVKRLVHIAADAPAAVKAGCQGPIFVGVGAFAPLAVLVTLWLSYRVARRWFSEPACALAVVVVGLASPLNVFGSLTWYYSHVWAALSVAICLSMAVRADDAPEKTARWFVAGLGGGLAALTRPQEGLWVLVAVASILAHAWAEDRARARVRQAVLRGVVLSVGFAAVFWIQLFVYQKVYGSPLVVPQGKLYVQLAHAHPWLLLFGARSGLLYWTPVLWIAVIGAALFAFDGRRRAVAAAIVLAMIGEHYVTSSALAWTGSATLGARVQTSLAAGLVVTGAAGASAFLRFLRRRRWASFAIASAILGPWIFVTWEIGPAGLPFERPVPAPQLYGTGTTFGVNAIYESVGNPFTLPMTVPFSLRYGAPLKVFDLLATEGIFVKHYRTLAVSNDTLRFASPPTCFWSDGFAPDAVVLPGKRARFLLTLYWPWTTRLRITGKALDGAADLTLRSGSAFRRRNVGTVHFEGEATLDVDVPNGALDSGINELLLESSAPLKMVSWQFIDDARRDTSVRVLQRK